MMTWEEREMVLKQLEPGTRMKVMSTPLDMMTAIWLDARIDEYELDEKMKSKGKPVPKRNEWMSELALERFKSYFVEREVVLSGFDASGYIWRGHWAATTDKGEVRTPRYGSLREDLDFIQSSTNEDAVRSMRSQLEYYLLKGHRAQSDRLSFDEVLKFEYTGKNYDGDTIQVEDWCPLFNVYSYYDEESEEWIDIHTEYFDERKAA